MESDVQIREIDSNPSSLKEKIKEKLSDKKNIIIICAVVVVLIIILCFIFRSRSNPLSHYDYLIVGTGLYGATFNYLAKKAGKTTYMIEKRDVVGGNLYCEKKEGIWIHKYGPHVFHTDNKKVWDFVNNMTNFNPYIQQTVARVEDTLYSLPFNMWTYYQLWGVTTPQEAKEKIDSQKFTGEVTNLEEQAMSLVGKDIYKKLIKGYTEKQWGRKCTELPPFIIKRLPTRFTFDGNYFNDRYQGIPEGCYNAMIDQLLKDTKIETGVDYNKNKEKYENIADKIVYTGKIDEYFGYKLGKLEYRTVRWETEVKDVANFQGAAVINQPDKDVPYTRIIEHKHFEPYNKELQEMKKTVISKEFSEEWDETKEGYYPVNDEKNNKLYQQYKEMADKETNVIFGGRLAEYKYYDMKDIIENVFKLWEM